MSSEIVHPVAKRHKVSEKDDTPLFDDCHVPFPVIGKILELLDIASLVRVGACNSSWRHQVYGDANSGLWKCIDFGRSQRESALLTDNQLGGLLTRCNARNRCQILKLEGCFQVRGNGLEPLRGSHILRYIDLRPYGRTNVVVPSVDAGLVLPILNSMPPIARQATPSGHLGLVLVKFERFGQAHSSNTYDPRVRQWLSHHDDCREALAKIERAKQEQLQDPRCDHCARDILDSEFPEDDLGWRVELCFCEVCKKVSCHGCMFSAGSKCPMVNECEDCGLRSCDPCYADAPVSDDHIAVIVCNLCARHVCEPCMKGSGGYCAECQEWYCDENNCSGALRACNIDGCCAVSDSGDDEALFCPECIAPHERDCRRTEAEQQAESNES